MWVIKLLKNKGQFNGSIRTQGVEITQPFYQNYKMPIYFPKSVFKLKNISFIFPSAF